MHSKILRPRVIYEYFLAFLWPVLVRLFILCWIAHALTRILQLIQIHTFCWLSGISVGTSQLNYITSDSWWSESSFSFVYSKVIFIKVRIFRHCRSLLLLSAYYDSQCKEFVLFKSASPFTVDSFPAGKRGRKYVIVLELKIRTPRNFNFIKSMESVPLLQKTREAVLSYTYTINHSNCKKKKKKKKWINCHTVFFRWNSWCYLFLWTSW